ncbi:MAG: hypothetical protein ACYC5X_09835 [Syntrophales bacterium]
MGKLAVANTLILDEPTNHLDLESLTALNNELIAFPKVLLLSSRDHEPVSTVVNRIVEITPDGAIDRVMGFEEYLEAGWAARSFRRIRCIGLAAVLMYLLDFRFHGVVFKYFALFRQSITASASSYITSNAAFSYS